MTSAAIEAGCFAARVVGRDDHDIRPTLGGLAHERPLAVVAIAAAAEDADDVAGRELSRRA